MVFKKKKLREGRDGKEIITPVLWAMFIPIIWYYCIDLQLYEHIIQNSIENFCIKICSWTDNMPLSSKPLFEMEITCSDFLKQ